MSSDAKRLAVWGLCLKLTRPWLIHTRKGILSYHVDVFGTADLFISLLIQFMSIVYITYTQQWRSNVAKAGANLIT